MSADLLYSSGGGVFRGPSATPMGAGVSQALGLQGGALPGVAPSVGTVQPVMLVADTSDRLSRGLIEPRGFAAGRITPGADRFKLRMQARSGGGVLIERLALIPDGSTVFACDIRATGLTFTAPATLQQFACGGAPIASRVEASQGNAEVVGGASIPSSLLAQAFTELRWFVPPSMWLVIQGSNTQACNYAVLWRELEE